MANQWYPSFNETTDVIDTSSGKLKPFQQNQSVLSAKQVNLALGEFTNTIISSDTVILGTESYSETTPYNISGVNYDSFTSSGGALYHSSFDIGNNNVTSITVDKQCWGVAYADTYSTGVSLYSGVWHVVQQSTAKGATIDVSAHRYWQFIVYQGLAPAHDTGYAAPTFTCGLVTNYSRYFTTGRFISDSIYLGEDALSFGTITVDSTLNTGTTLAFYIRSSNDNVNWNDWALFTSPATITFIAGKYVKIRIDFTTPIKTGGATSYTPVLNSITVTTNVITNKIDYGFTPVSFGTFAVTHTIPSGCSIDYKTRSSADGITWEDWIAVLQNASITSTVNRYLEWYAFLTPSGTDIPSVGNLYVGSTWRSTSQHLTKVSAWGNYNVVQAANSQTITHWMRSAGTEDGLSVATWYEQTVNAAIANMQTGNDVWVQVEVRFNTNLATQVPEVSSIEVVYTRTTTMLNPVLPATAFTTDNPETRDLVSCWYNGLLDTAKDKGGTMAADPQILLTANANMSSALVASTGGATASNNLAYYGPARNVYENAGFSVETKIILGSATTYTITLGANLVSYTGWKVSITQAGVVTLSAAKVANTIVALGAISVGVANLGHFCVCVRQANASDIYLYVFINGNEYGLKIPEVDDYFPCLFRGGYNNFTVSVTTDQNITLRSIRLYGESIAGLSEKIKDIALYYISRSWK